MFVSYLKSTNNQFLASQSSHYDKVTFSAALNRYLLGLHEMKCYAVSVKFKFLKRVYTWCIPIEPYKAMVCLNFQRGMIEWERIQTSHLKSA